MFWEDDRTLYDGCIVGYDGEPLACIENLKVCVCVCVRARVCVYARARARVCVCVCVCVV